MAVEDMLGDEGAYLLFLARLQNEDSTFRQASLLPRDESAGWQSATYLLTGWDSLWECLGSEVLSTQGFAKILTELERFTYPWSSSEQDALAWTAYFWRGGKTPALPYSFDRSKWIRWVHALCLRLEISPETLG